MKLPALLAPALLVSLSSCIVVIDGEWGGGWDGYNGLRGSGIEVREERSVESFDEISILHSMDVEVEVGAETAVTVIGDDNLVARVVTWVDGDELIVDVDSDEWLAPRRGLLVRISTPHLTAFSIEGSSDAVVRGVDSERLVLSIEGSGDVTVSGRTGRLEASISGSGDMDLQDLQAVEATLSISGSGEIEASVSGSLDASISGSGDIRYHGNPSTTMSVSGSGSIGRD